MTAATRDPPYAARHVISRPPRRRPRAKIDEMKRGTDEGDPDRAGRAGSYVMAERRPDGALVLEPERESLSAVIAATDGRVFCDDDFAEHLRRVAASDDDLPPAPHA